MTDVRSAVETERSYDVADPDATPVVVAYLAREAGVEHTGATYLDTRRGDLARRRITLRRREGGHDAGWHLELPADEGRTELTAPLRDELPEDFAARLAAILRGRRVWPIARVETMRTRWRLRDDSGRELAELADDLVRSTRVRGRVRRSWREWEVELLPGAAKTPEARTAILEAVEADLLRAGAVPSASPSTLARALGRDRLGADLPLRTRTALGAVLPPMRALIDSAVREDPGAREDAPDAVHRYRVEVRRIRALLASTRDVLAPEATEPLRRRLHRLQTALEPARDSEVRRTSAAALLERGLPDPSGVLGRYVVARADAEHEAAIEALVAHLATRGHLRLLDDLDRIVDRPPLARRSLARAVPTLRRDLLRQARRASRRLAATDPTSLPSLHDGRKAVRRVRYLAEALTEGDAAVLGDVVARLGRAAKALQDDLGDARDAELHAERLDALAEEAVAGGEDVGPLREAARLERATAQDLLAGVPEARRDFEEARAAVESASETRLVERAPADASGPD